MNNLKFIFRRFNYFLCDLALCYALFYLFLFIRPIGFLLMSCYFCLLVLYFTLTYGIFHASLMQKVSGITIKKHTGFYAFFKILFTGVIPFCITFFFYEFFLFFFLFWYLAIVLLLSMVLLLFAKKSIWQLLSGSQFELQNNSNKNRSLIIIPLLTVLFLICFQFFRQIHNSDGIDSKNIVVPISIPEKAYYVKNINQYKQEPVHYVMQLFDKYDIVILCERMHSEYTQWEFFSSIILNDTFALKVKNVFTEVGQAQNQEILNSYMSSHFSTEEDLQKATARIVRESGGGWPIWNNTNIYDFIFNLHQFNETKENEHRINLFFSDILINWDEIKNPVQWDSVWYNVANRDSIMAYNIINQYDKSANKKCLVITNSRHAWRYGENEAAYICKKFPDKTAIVLINGTTQTTFPPMNGTLDKAAAEIPDSIWAIDFEKCPLGNTVFDLMPNKRDRCTYKDLFVGMVYYKRSSEWEIRSNYPFILNNYKDTLLKRSALVGEKYFQQTKKLIETGYFNEIKNEEFSILKTSNLVFFSLHCIILIFLAINLLVLLYKKQRKTVQ